MRLRRVPALSRAGLSFRKEKKKQTFLGQLSGAVPAVLSARPRSASPIAASAPGRAGPGRAGGGPREALAAPQPPRLPPASPHSPAAPSPARPALPRGLPAFATCRVPRPDGGQPLWEGRGAEPRHRERGWGQAAGPLLAAGAEGRRSGRGRRALGRLRAD